MSLSLLTFFGFMLQPYNIFGQTLDQGNWEKESKLGVSVDFSCSHTDLLKPYHIFWYQQRPGREPVYIRQVSNLGDPHYNNAFSNIHRFTLDDDKDSGKAVLTNKGSTANDAAAYICASNHMSEKHLQFGNGNRLRIIPETDVEASAYIHKSGADADGPTACLVRDSGPAVAWVSLSGETIRAEPTVATGESNYGLVAVSSRNCNDCWVKQGNEEIVAREEENQCIPNTDEKMNFLHITVLGLRLLCVKTVVVCVLLTVLLLSYLAH
ncbi:hypothetical protein ACEWY4_026308 [Coilia grayii]|uniref:Ig-like domain-containing protein n=1 Tax=Coilia grayii TaxID=363190 RepID=A0ABD1IUG7_9TELE